MSRARRGSVLTSWRQDPACVPASATLSPPSPHPLLALPRPLPHSEKLAGIRLEVEDVALTAASQRRKLEVVLEAANRSLQVEQPQVKWSVDSTWGLGPGRRPGQGWRSLGPSAAGAVAQPSRVWAQPRRWDRGRSLRQAPSGHSAEQPKALLFPEVVTTAKPRTWPYDRHSPVSHSGCALSSKSSTSPSPRQRGTHGPVSLMR